MSHENFDDCTQRVQDRLRAAGDDEAAELIDELLGLLHGAAEAAAPTPTPAAYRSPGVHRTQVLKEPPPWVDVSKLPGGRWGPPDLP